MTVSQRTDEDLMLAFQRRDVDAFEELFRRYEQPLWGYFRRRVADVSRAEELTQDTFLAVLRGVERYEPRATFRTYLYSIAFNLLAADRRAARTLVPVDESTTPAGSASIDDQVWMRQAMARLEDGDRAVLYLREFEQLSYVEIAGVLDVPLNTVRSRLFRAREALRRLLVPAATLEEGRDR